MMETDFRCFFSMRQWMQSSSELRFSMGARVHGNIVALQCGVPSLVVIHDERTRELADCLRLPSLMLAEFFRLGSLAEAIDAALAGVKHYVSRRRELGREFMALLDENGLVPSPELRSFCSSPAPDGVGKRI
jgi:polysaccharide pyruvyl transferase WcaK-like protein